MIGHLVKRARMEQQFADFTAFCDKQIQRIERNLRDEPQAPHVVEYEASLNTFDRIEREQGIPILPREEFEMVSR